MRRLCIYSFLGASAFFAAPVPSACGAVLFLDAGDATTGVQGGPIGGTNPGIGASPDSDVTLYLWAVPDDDDNKVLAGLGHNIALSGAGAPGVTALSYTLYNPTLGSVLRWNATTLAGGLNLGSHLVSDMRAVFVPTKTPFVGGVGSANLGIDPFFDAKSGAVLLGRLDLRIDGDAPLGTSAELRLSVSPLLIAHVTAGTWRAENVFFGYSGGAPEAATGSGSTSGATSLEADAVINIVDSSIPTVSQWGSVQIVLLLLVAGTVAFRRRHNTHRLGEPR